jgi:hypothetical protein
MSRGDCLNFILTHPAPQTFLVRSTHFAQALEDRLDYWTISRHCPRHVQVEDVGLLLGCEVYSDYCLDP